MRWLVIMYRVIGAAHPIRFGIQQHILESRPHYATIWGYFSIYIQYWFIHLDIFFLTSSWWNKMFCSKIIYRNWVISLLILTSSNATLFIMSYCLICLICSTLFYSGVFQRQLLRRTIISLSKIKTEFYLYNLVFTFGEYWIVILCVLPCHPSIIYSMVSSRWQ